MGTLMEVAIHEAGHAVFTRVLGRHIEEIHVYRGTANDYRGVSGGDMHALERWWWRATAPDPLVPARTIEDLTVAEVPITYLWGQMCLELAGEAAVDLASTPFPDRAGLGPNHRAAKRYATFLACQLQQPKGYILGRGRIMARDVLGANTGAVSALVQALCDAIASDPEGSFGDVPDADEIVDSAGINRDLWSALLAGVPSVRAHHA